MEMAYPEEKTYLKEKEEQMNFEDLRFTVSLVAF